MTERYVPFDGDYDENKKDDLIKFTGDLLGDYGVYRELCLSMEDDKIRVLTSNDAGEEWIDDDRYDIPEGWTVDQARDLFQYGNIYFHTGVEFPDTEFPDDED